MNILKKQISDDILLFTVSNEWMSFSAMNYGCAITNIFVPDKHGNLVDVVLGCPDLDGYKKDWNAQGSIVGRFANRIAGAKFFLDGKTYLLDKGSGNHCLHSGKNRFEKMVWQPFTFVENDKAGIVFRRTSVENEQGFPGNVEIEISYVLDSKNQLTLNYNAITDKATPISLTNHSYFNLAGQGTVLNHQLVLDCKEILEVTDELIPTGNFLPVVDSPFDFLEKKSVGKDIPKISKILGGYDHCFVTKAYETKTLENVGTIYEDSTGISMNVRTNQPGIQIYSGNFLGGSKGKNGVKYEKYSGICFETQQFPDSPNHGNFPDCILRPGETYNAETVFKFENIRNIL